MVTDQAAQGITQAAVAATKAAAAAAQTIDVAMDEGSSGTRS